jgi:sporulation protein YlmC with PRC-barrel domain
VTKIKVRTPYEYSRLYGRDVITSDGIKIGHVDQFVFSSFKDAPYLLVRTGPYGRLTGTDALYIPEAAIKSIAETVVLEPTKDHLRHDTRWAAAPPGHPPLIAPARLSRGLS